MIKWICTGAFVLLCLVVSTGGAVAPPAAADSTSASVPSGVRMLLSPTDTLLAYKPMESLGNGGDGAVIVVRHALTDDRSHNPCDLTVLRKTRDTFVVVVSSNHAVECIYNDIARRAGEFALDDQLNVKPHEITWSNELSKGHTLYTFAYASETSSWFLQRAEVTSAENAEAGDGINVYKEVATYPDDFARVDMSDFNPRAIRTALAKHRKLVK